LGDVRLRSVELYVDNFHSWLVDNYMQWNDENHLRSDILQAFYFDFQRIWNRMKRLENQTDHESIVRIWMDEIEQAEHFDVATASSRRVADLEFERLWSSEFFESNSIRSSFDFWFDDVAQSSEILELAQRYVKASIGHRYPGSNSDLAHLCFVGYGNNELLPTVASLFVYGAMKDHIYAFYDGKSSAQRQGSGVYLIRPLGQFDAIDLFFRGYESGFVEATKTAVSRALEDANVKEISEEAELILESPMNQIGSLIENSFRDYSESTKLAGLRRTVAGMPLASLVRTTKHLIGIQRLSLEIAGELQTVGGQVDVGTITLKDGFTWIRQKDYSDFVD
jgi:hypothetical protein